MSIKWDIIRKKRDELMVVQQEVIDKNIRADKFVHLLLFYVTLKKHKMLVMQGVMKRVQKMKLIFMINMLKYKFKRKFARLRPTLEERFNNMTRYALNFSEPMILEKVNKERASKEILKFMFRRDLNFSVHGYVKHYCIKTIFIQQAWRRHSLSLK